MPATVERESLTAAATARLPGELRPGATLAFTLTLPADAHAALDVGVLRRPRMPVLARLDGTHHSLPR
jgi:hypothetical protein